jgi:hypothetical protein
MNIPPDARRLLALPPPLEPRQRLDQSSAAVASVPAKPPFLPRDCQTTLRLPEYRQDPAQAIYRKLDVSSRAEAVDSASSAGLLGDEQNQEGASWHKPGIGKAAR